MKMLRKLWGLRWMLWGLPAIFMGAGLAFAQAGPVGPTGPVGPVGPEASLTTTALSGIIGSGPLVGVLAFLLWRLWLAYKAERDENARLHEECKDCRRKHAAEIAALYRELVAAVDKEDPRGS